MSNINRNPFIYYLPSSSTDSSSFQLNNNVQIVVSPANISAVKNPIIWQLKSSAITSTISYAELSINVNAVGAEGDYWGFSGNTIIDYPSFELTANDEPGILQYYSSGTTPSRTPSQVAECICSVLNEDFNFRDRFFAIQSGTTVIIRAIENGTRYNMNFYASNSNISQNYVINSVDENRGQNLKDYAVWADVYYGSDGYYSSAPTINRTGSTYISSIEIDYNPDNEYNFNVSNFIEPYLSTQLPLTGQTTFWRDTTANNNFYLVFGEKYDEFENNYRRRFLVGQTEIAWANHTQLDYLLGSNLSGYVLTNTTVSGDNRQFLTSAPSIKETLTNQLEYLTMIFEGDGSLAVCLKGYYELWDGTKYNFEKQNTSTMDNGGQYYVDCSYSTLNFGASYDVRRYVLGVYRYTDGEPESSRILISPIRTFEVQPDCPAEYQKHIVWLDNGWETFIFNGEIEEEIDRDFETFRVSLNFTPSRQDVLNQLINIETKKIITAKTRWINKEHFDWLMTIAKSSDVRLYEDGIFKSIYVTKLDYKLNSEENLYKVEIQYIKSAEENQLNNI
jgi:hypothetical protein